MPFLEFIEVEPANMRPTVPRANSDCANPLRSVNALLPKSPILRGPATMKWLTDYPVTITITLRAFDGVEQLFVLFAVICISASACFSSPVGAITGKSSSRRSG